MKKIIVFLFTICAFCQIIAQTAEGPDVTLKTPYNTIYSHLYYLQPDSYQPQEAAKTIYGVTDNKRAIRLAVQLKQVLDGKGLYVYPHLLPQDSNYVDSLSKNAYYTLFPDELPEVFLEKVGDNWYYSANTVDQISRLHKEVYPFGSDKLLNILPRLGQSKIMGLAIWQYIAMAILLLIGFFVHQILSRLLNPIVKRFSQSRLNPDLVSTALIRKTARLISILLVVRLIDLFLPVLQLPIGIMRFLVMLLAIISIVLIAFLGLRILDIIMLYAGNVATKTHSKLDEQLMPIVKRTIQFVIIIGGIVQILRLLDVNVTALIAGISIGGLALALAAQDTVKNLIGSAMIFVDKPFQIGDYIEGGGVAGTVVEVGFRTTRLKQSDSSIMAVPNGTIANAAITNKGVRVYRLYQTNLGITYATPPDLIERFVGALRELIEEHPMTLNDNYYVHVTDLADSAITVLFRTAMLVDEQNSEFETKETLILSVLRLAERMGVEFAYPSTSVYLEKK